MYGGIIMLIYISIVSYSLALGLVLFLIIYPILKKKGMDPLEKELIKRRQEASTRKTNSLKFYQEVYEVYLKFPFIRVLVLQLMKRFTLIGEKDKSYLVRKVVQLISVLLLLDIILLMVFWQVTHNALYLGIFLFFLWYVAGSYLDYFVAKGQLQLLEQMITFIGLVRQKFYEFGMIDDAIYEATIALDEKDREMAVHGERIYEVLLSSQNEKMMTEYNETAPNPYLKMLLNLSYMTMEYGDQVVDKQSVFLTNLSFLTKNIHLEIDKRSRLNYALKSMNIIVMLPLFLMSVIKNWAISNFPPLGFFYRSPTGKYIEVITIFLMLLSMVLLNHIGRIDVSQGHSERLRKFFSSIKLPLSERLKRKWFYGIGTFITVVILFLSIQQSAKWKLKDMVYYESQFLGAELDQATYEKRRQESLIDYDYIKKNAASIVAYTEEVEKVEAIRLWIGNKEEPEREAHIQEKARMYHSYYLKYWHIIIAWVLGSVGYFMPEISKHLSKKLKEMDLDDEVAGFRSIIMMLMHHPRMNVEEIGIWLESYAFYFKEELHRCLLNLASGEYNALMESYYRIEHSEMKRLLYQLAMASEDIKLEEAFDELLQEKNTFFEQRKWQNEKLIQRKMILGQNIGFLPAYSLIILYMIVPMIVASTSELNRFFSQM
jgi:hypothetical protein